MGAFVNNAEDMTLEVKICGTTNGTWTCSAIIKNFFDKSTESCDFIVVPNGVAVEGTTKEEREEDALNIVRTWYMSGHTICINSAQKKPELAAFFNESADFFEKLFSGEKEIKTIVVHEN